MHQKRFKRRRFLGALGAMFSHKKRSKMACKKLIPLTIFLIIGNLSFASASTEAVDSILKVLDTAIKNKTIYDSQKQAKIDSLQWMIEQADNDEQRYQIYRGLFGEYRSYNADSALAIAYRRLDVSRKLQNKRRINTSRMNIAEAMTIGGMYNETVAMLDSIDRRTIEQDQFPYYYHLYHSIYNLMKKHVLREEERAKYAQLSLQYKDSCLSVSHPDWLTYYVTRANKFFDQGDYEQARIEISNIYEKFGQEIYKDPIVAYTIANLCHYEGNVEQEKFFLSLAAINDIESGNKEYIALWELAVLLFRTGEVERAHTYIKCAMEDATSCRAIFRTLEIAEILPLIVSAYDLKMKQEQEKLYKNLLVITLLSVLLVIALLLIYLQLRKIQANREFIKQINENLKNSNEDLLTLNKQLLESNCVKEEYIGYAFNLCSNYINKLESYRKDINRKLKLQQINQVLQLTASDSLVSNELKEFFHTFDQVFMKLYPCFVTEFNSLLAENEQIIPKGDEILTPELRVYALIRLGISDNAKIANFLNYTLQTVYNYRFKIRDKSILSKEDFNAAVLRIGMKQV